MRNGQVRLLRSPAGGLPLQTDDGAALTALESPGRYITGPTLAMDALQRLRDGNLVLETPPDPRTGATGLVLDALEWIPRITGRIPDPGRHCQRFYGAYSNRGRVVKARVEGDCAHGAADSQEDRDNADTSREARSTWARLVRKIFEAEALVCACGAGMRIVSFIADPRVVDRILRHRESERCKAKDSCDSRKP